MPQPRDTQSCITCQMRSSPPATSPASRQVSSFFIMSCATLRPLSRHMVSSSRPVRNGYGNWSCAAMTWLLEAPAVTTKPPPTDR